MIILVKGITGSGKTFIATQLNGIKCVDTDDLYYKAYDEKPSPMKQVHKRVVKILQDEIKHNKFIVITGNDMEEIKPDITYFIKLTNIEQVYKRLINRELIRIKDAITSDVLSDMQNMNASDITTHLRMKCRTGIDPFSLTFNDYKEKYKQKILKQDPTTLIYTQENIIKDIQKKYNTINVS